jgi:hypothetical protein
MCACVFVLQVPPPKYYPDSEYHDSYPSTTPPKYYPDSEYSDSYGSGGYHPKDITCTLKESLISSTPPVGVGAPQPPALATITTRRWVCCHLCARLLQPAQLRAASRLLLRLSQALAEGWWLLLATLALLWFT